MTNSLAPRLIRFGQAMLPFATVFACISITYALSDSPVMQLKIHSTHNDLFTLQLSEKMLAISKVTTLVVVATSLPIFLIFKYRFAGHHAWRWEKKYSIATALAAVSLVLRLWQCPLALDDAYVDYRYVQHWLAGLYDYNPGQHVMGFTSHLHLCAVYLTCLLSHTRMVDLASHFLNCALDTLNTLFLFFLVSKVYKRMLPGVVAALIFAFSMYSSGEVISGKETPLVTLVQLTAMWALQTSRLQVLPWTACALFLLRPEGLLSCMVILSRVFRPTGKMAWKSCLWPCGLTLAYYVFLFCYFGSILPHGMIAKSKVFPPGDFLAILFEYIRVAGCIMTNSVLSYCLSFMGWWSFFFLTIISFIYGYMRFKQPCWKLYLDMALVQMLFLITIQPLHFSWYLCWFNLMGPIFTAHVAARFWPRIRAGKMPLLVPARALMCIYLWCFVCTGLYWIPYDWIPYLERGTLYRDAALYMMEKTGGQATIAASDVGILGYYYSGRIQDLMGLVSDETLKFYPVSTDKGRQYLIPPRAIAELKPKYVLAPVNHCLGMLLDDPDFQRDYTELKRWTNPDILDKVVAIWVRRDEIEKPPDK